MGGLSCVIVRNAKLQFVAVPTAPAKLKEFDEQMRELLSTSTIAEAMAEDEQTGDNVCLILAKRVWTHEDRQFLFDAVDDLYEDDE